MTTPRSRFELYLDVLCALSEGVCGPTLIMSKTMVSWGLMKDVLCDLVTVGFIECRINNSGSRKKSYYITSKGEEFLLVFNKKEIRYLLTSVNIAAYKRSHTLESHKNI